MGTKIAYKRLGYDPNEDYTSMINKLAQEENTAKSAKELKRLLKDPNVHYIQVGKNDLYAVNKLTIF